VRFAGTMMGVTLAPVTGAMIAQILSGQAPPYDMAALSPDRCA
jgi:glycine/D-amino acid oxidase-like deaminating enzyme